MFLDIRHPIVDICALLIRTRKRFGLNQREWAGRVHVEQSKISRWETGQLAPTLLDLHAVAIAAERHLHVDFVVEDGGQPTGATLLVLSRLDPALAAVVVEVAQLAEVDPNVRALLDAFATVCRRPPVQSQPPTPKKRRVAKKQAMPGRTPR